MISQRTRLPYSTDPAVKPAWYLNERGTVMVRCACGIVGAITAPISDEGEVELHHDVENYGCDWHVLAILERWDIE